MKIAFFGAEGKVGRALVPVRDLGWYLAALGCILECAGGAVRAGSTERPRKPPGVL